MRTLSKDNRLLGIQIGILLFFFHIGASAQIGFKGGVGVSDIAFLKNGQLPYLGYDINQLEHKVPKLSFQLGSMATFELTRRIEFQPELLYTLKGLDYSTKYLYDDITYQINLHYLEVPLLFRYKICLKEKKQSGFLLGPYGAWKFSAKKVTEFEGQREKTNMSNVKGYDFGIIGGYALDFDLLSGQMVIDLRCSYSLVNIMDPIEGHLPWYYGPTKDYARNVNISLTVGYRFLNIWQKKDKK